MRLSDLLDHALPISIKGKEFILRRIKLRAILHIMVRFSDQLGAFARSDKRDAEALLLSLDNGSMADLFAFLLEPYDPLHLRNALDEAVARELSILLASTNDLDRVWRSFSFARPAEADGAMGDTAPVVPVLLSIIDIVAERYKIDPMRVLDWPYEAFLTVTEMLEAKLEGAQQKHLADLLSSLGLSPELATVPGVSFSPVANDLSKEH